MITVLFTEDGIELTEAHLTYEEARALASCRLKWKACKRADTRRQAEVADRRRRTLWLWVVAVSGSVCFTGASYLAATEGKAGVGFLCTAAAALWAIYSLSKAPSTE